MRHKIAHLIGRFKYTIATNIDDFMFEHLGYFFGRRLQSVCWKLQQLIDPANPE